MKLYTSCLSTALHYLGIGVPPVGEFNDDSITEYFKLDDLYAREPGKLFAFTQSYHHWPYLIFEQFAGSSQLDRFKTCSANFPILAIALDGQGFHGQHERHWETGMGNLYLSAYMPVQWFEKHCHMPMNCITPKSSENISKELLNFLQNWPCISVLKACQSVLKLKKNTEISIKLPNDIIVKQEAITYKLAGCLTELVVQDSMIQAIRIGIGLNIHHTPQICSNYGISAICCEAIHTGDPSHLYTELLNKIALYLLTIDQDMF